MVIFTVKMTKKTLECHSCANNGHFYGVLCKKSKCHDSVGDKGTEDYRNHP